MCPKCSGQKFAVMPKFQQPYEDVATIPFPPLAVAFPKNKWTGIGKNLETFGHFETWICLGCGYTEFYARELEDLEQIIARINESLEQLKLPGSAEKKLPEHLMEPIRDTLGVHIVDGAAGRRGPFR